MDNLLLTDHNRSQLTALLANPPHALLLIAPHGWGKRHLATTWGRQLAPLVEVIEPDDKGTISIDTIRALYQRTRTKQAQPQVVIIDHAEAMGIEAQNAYLKLLEEPRPGVTFVLTAPSSEALLPTIGSRLQSVQLQLLPHSALQTWATEQKKLNPQDLAQLLFVAQGRPGTLSALLHDDTAFTRHRQLMQRAKQLLSAKPYDRLAAIPELLKNKDDVVATLEAMGHMAKIQLAKGDRQWLGMAEALQTCLTALANNGNPRAQLTHFFTSY